MKKIFIPIFLCFVITFCAVTPVVSKSEDISQKVFRMHILANSDSESDQQLKLKVRDSILREAQTIYKNCNSVSDAIAATQINLNDIVSTAENTISQQGYDYSVNAFVTKEYFNTRKYDSFTMPAGVYNCIKIIIGEGKGKNWWCVMFPQVCISSCTDEFENYLTDDEINMLTSNGYIVRFKAVEIIEKLKSKTIM